MADTRERILVQLLALVGARVVHAARNDMNVSEDTLPAGIVFDADEELDPIEDDRRRDATAKRLVRMTPEIAILLAADVAQVGSELNRVRKLLINDIATDATLAALVGPNGFVRYENCETDLGWGRATEGKMLVRFMFCYVLDPTTVHQ